MNEITEINISPSDLSYFWSDSKVGFYDKYVLQIQRPKQAFPAMFNTIDGYMRSAFDQIDCTDIVEGAPEGAIWHEDIYVQSIYIQLGKYKISFKGKIDCLLDHGDGWWSVVYYKTTRMSEWVKNIYFLQLMAYAFALEKPMRGEPKKIKGLGLLIFDPKDFSFETGKSKASLNGSLHWVEIPFDKAKFKQWLNDDLMPLLNCERDDIFKSSTDNDWQRYISCYDIEGDDDDNSK